MGDRRQQFGERLLGSVSGAFDIAAAYFGIRLGLYRSLADDGPATSTELAGRTGTDERMVREWLEQQGATEVLDVDRDGDGTLRFALPPEHAAVLLDPTALDGMAGSIRSLMAELCMVPRLLDTFRTGVGIPYADYGPDESEGQAMSSRPLYEAEVASWLRAVPGIGSRLAAGDGAGVRLLDIGCGSGWSSVNMAKAWPALVVDGVDLDAASIAAARANAEAEGVADRVRFEVQDAAELAGAGYDLATMFEMLHDLARPVEALAAARAAVGDDGVVLVADERTRDRYELPATPIEQRHYGWSLLHCLPAALTVPDSAATGTVIRPTTVRTYATRAGFRQTTLLPLHSEAFHLYVLHP